MGSGTESLACIPFRFIPTIINYIVVLMLNFSIIWCSQGVGPSQMTIRKFCIRMHRKFVNDITKKLATILPLVLTTLDFFVRGYVESQVDDNEPWTISKASDAPLSIYSRYA